MPNLQTFQTRNLILLMCGQGLSGSLLSLLTLATPLCTQNLIIATNIPQNLVTLPISATILGAFLMIYNASILMEKLGRQRAFVIASALGIFASILAMVAILLYSFWLFCVATFLLGCFNAFGQYYRFAASEIFLDSHTNDTYAQNKATALVVGGGILGAILGPFLASFGANLFTISPFNIAFLGSFFFAFLLCFCNLICSYFLKLPAQKFYQQEEKDSQTPSFLSLLKDKNFLLGTLACSFGFGFMILFMNATPLAMHHAHFDLTDNKSVLQWHFVAMYLPSLFLGFLLRKSSAQRVIFYGILAYIFCIIIAVIGESFYHFFFALLFLGVGWAFVFNGGTFLMNALPHSPYRFKIQGLHSCIIYLSNFAASLSVGFILHLPQGWIFLNIIGAVMLLLFIMIFYALNHNYQNIQ